MLFWDRRTMDQNTEQDVNFNFINRRGDNKTQLQVKKVYFTLLSTMHAESRWKWNITIISSIGLFVVFPFLSC